MNDRPALILTLELDPASMATFETLRRRYFPPERNIVPAHLSLFHALPGGAAEHATRSTVRGLAELQCPMGLPIVGVRSIGRGVAVFFDPKPVAGLHRALAAAFDAVLSPQDRQGFRPHVVLQNKVLPQTARETLATMRSKSMPGSVRAVGIMVWRYLDGPWQEAERIAFLPSDVPA